MSLQSFNDWDKDEKTGATPSPVVPSPSSGLKSFSEWSGTNKVTPVQQPVVDTRSQYQKDVEQIATRSTSETLFDKQKSEFNVAQKVGGWLLDSTLGGFEKNIRQKVYSGDIAKDVETGRLDPTVYNAFDKLNQSTAQDIGDAFEFAANAVTLAYGGSGLTNLASSKLVRPLSKEALRILTPETAALARKGVLKEATRTLLKEGAKEGSLIGLTYGISQALQSGSKDPGEITKIILMNTAGGTILGSAANVLIPSATRLVVEAVQSGVKRFGKQAVPSEQETLRLAKDVKEKVLNPIKTEEETMSERIAQSIQETPIIIKKQEPHQEPSPENTYVTVVNEKTNENTVYKIKLEDFDAVKNHIDDSRNGDAIAGEVIDDNKYHLTTKSIESIKEQGFKDGGEIGIKDLPKGNKITKSASDINKKYVEKGFDNIPEEEQAKFSSSEGQRKQQVENVASLMTEDIERAKQIARGEIDIPEDIKPQILHNAMVEWADKNGDYTLLRDLSGSVHASELSQSASLLESSKYGRTKKESAGQKTVKIMKGATKSRVEIAEKRAKSKGTTVKKQEERIKEKGANILKEEKVKGRSRPKLDAFINSLIC